MGAAEKTYRTAERPKPFMQPWWVQLGFHPVTSHRNRFLGRVSQQNQLRYGVRSVRDQWLGEALSRNIRRCSLRIQRSITTARPAAAARSAAAW